MKIPEFLKERQMTDREFRDISRRVRIPLKRSTRKLKKEWVKKIIEEQERRKEAAGTTDVKDLGQGKNIQVPYRVQVKHLAEIMEVPVTLVIGELMKNGIMANLNEEIDYETAAIIAEDLGFTTEEKQIDEEKEQLTSEKLQKILESDDENDLQVRPPVVTIMGHVDHGKTTLLDTIRETGVADGEHGGITQHIGAYQVTLKKQGKFKGRLITFLDTPGHEAFVSMRERGANSTDIAILVVAADDGVKPQTIESINHAKQAGVPIVVAINKMDKPEANPEKVKQELSSHDVLTEEWGGDTPVVEISAKAKQGIDDLLEMILLVADVKDVKANYDRPAIGTVIEAHLDKKRGPVATLLVQAGTLNRADHITIDNIHGTVRLMENALGERIKKAEPSMPIRIVGLNDVPAAGDIFQVISEKSDAWAKAKKQQANQRLQQRGTFGKVSMKRINQSIQSAEVTKLNIVLKTDVQGSLEAILQVLETIKHDEVEMRILDGAVGSINESDIHRARTGEAIIIGFNVSANAQAQKLAEETGIPILRYNVIYKLIEDIKGKLSDLLRPEEVKIVHGRMKVIAIFKRGRGEMIVGGKVTKDVIKNKTIAVVKRNDEEIGEGKIIQLQNEKKATSEVKNGYEAGITFQGDVIIEEGDVIESMTIEERIRTI